MKKITIIGSISQSPFIQYDIDLLKREYIVYPIDIPGSLNKSKSVRISQYISLGYTTIFDIIPKIFKSDMTYIWFADVHAVIPILLCKLLNKPSIVSIGGYEVSNFPELNYGMMREPFTFRSRICKWVLKNADVCLAPSDSYYKKSIPYCKNVICAPNCIITEEEISVGRKKIVILMVGSATEENYKLKGIPLYNEIAGNIPDIPFYLIGKYDESIKNKYNNINYIGNISHEFVLRLMNSALIYCQLSKTESFGVSVLEAMMNGCVPIVTDVDNLSTLIKNDGMVVQDNIESATRGINIVLNIISSSLCERIHKSACEKNEHYCKLRLNAFKRIEESYKC